MANVIRPLGFLLLGGVAGAAATYWLAPEAPEAAAEATSNASKEPLHWVAPMDPNYKSDKPGKSPMGMDLIPVYAESGSGKDAPGTVRISPNVVNNLGVRTGSVIQGRVPNDITTVGYVQYSEDDMAHVHPRVEGWIEKLYVKAEGEAVEKGKPLYTLYSPTLVNAQDELILALNRGNERLVNAAKERLTALNVPVSLIRQLTKTRELQRTLTVYAPTSGVIDNLNVREGMFIKPGDRVLSIAALDEVWVIGEVFERQLSAVASDNHVVMTLDYLPGRQWIGKVDYVYYPLTTAMLSVPGAETVRGYSFFGDSYVYVIFDEDTDMYWARSRVLEYLSQVAPNLPDSARPQLGPDATGVGWVYLYALVDRTGQNDLSQLRSLQDWFLKYELQTVPGVSEVAALGGMVKQYQVKVSPEKLRALGIPLSLIQTAIKQGNQEVGASVIEMAEAEYMVRTSGYIQSCEDLMAIPLGLDVNGTPVLLQDVASVEVGPQMRRGIAELNGEGETLVASW